MICGVCGYVISVNSMNINASRVVLRLSTCIALWELEFEFLCKGINRPKPCRSKTIYMVTQPQKHIFSAGVAHCFSYSCLSFAEDLNWNALEWDRAAEELTWERVRIFFFSFFFFFVTLRLLLHKVV